MSLSRRNPRRDANEGDIIDALEKCGVQCFRVSGAGLFDVVTLWQGKYLPLEIKTAKGRLRPSQQHAPWPCVRSVEEALCRVGVRRLGDRP